MRAVGSCMLVLVGLFVVIGQSKAEQLGGQVREQRLECSPEKTIYLIRTKRLNEIFRGSESTCDSLASVFSRLSNKSKPGGRKLEESRPLDRNSAADQLNMAQRDSDYIDDLKQALSGEVDPLRRRIIEAAILDKFEYYLARDLVLQELKGALE